MLAHLSVCLSHTHQALKLYSVLTGGYVLIWERTLYLIREATFVPSISCKLPPLLAESDFRDRKRHSGGDDLMRAPRLLPDMP